MKSGATPPRNCEDFTIVRRREQELKLLVLGEILWDVFDDFEILDGAPLNLSVAA